MSGARRQRTPFGYFWSRRGFIRGTNQCNPIAVKPPITLSDLDLPLSSSEELPTFVSKAAMFFTCPSDPGNGGPRLRQCAPQSLQKATHLCVDVTPRLAPQLQVDRENVSFETLVGNQIVIVHNDCWAFPLCDRFDGLLFATTPALVPCDKHEWDKIL